MAFKFKVRSPSSGINLPPLPRRFEATEEMLTGEVNGMQASAPEERLARSLQKKRIPFVFRYVVGAPKGMPGWKELDFIVQHGGIVYPVEVDTAFTHRNKEYKDVLHDAIILNDRQIRQMGTVYPTVFHVDGDSDLASEGNSDAFVNRTFGS